MRDIFDKIASSRKDTDWDVNLYEKVRKAAIIRYYLAGVVERLQIEKIFEQSKITTPVLSLDMFLIFLYCIL